MSQTEPYGISALSEQGKRKHLHRLISEISAIPEPQDTYELFENDRIKTTGIVGGFNSIKAGWDSGVQVLLSIKLYGNYDFVQSSGIFIQR